MPDPSSLVTLGAGRFLQGLRTGDQRMLLAGAAITAFGLWRRSTRPKKVLVSRTVVREGTSLVVRNGSDQSPVEVHRVDPAI